MIIPLVPGRPFLRFRASLSERQFVFDLNWSTRYGFYSVDVYEDGNAVILGRGLHPDVDIFHGLNLGIGKLYLSGAPATVKNLGISNELRYEA